jgi:hypothetical protein
MLATSYAADQKKALEAVTKYAASPVQKLLFDPYLSTYMDGGGSKCVRITYTCPPVKVVITMGENVKKNPLFFTCSRAL